MNKEEFENEILPNLRRKCFDTLKAYVPGDQPQNIEQWIKLNTNENPFPTPKSIITELQDKIIKRMHMYPDPTAKELKEKILNVYLSQYKNLDLTVDNICLANGSDEIFDILFKTFIDKRENVLFFSPSYGMYDTLAESYEAAKIMIPLKEEDFSIDMEKIKFKENDKVLIICSPNNPSGGIITNEQLKTLCEQFNGVIFVDEAYSDFSNTSALDLIGEFPNLMVGKTFSKAFGMASIRLGFVIANKKIIQLFNTIRLPYNVTYFSQMAGIAGLNAWKEVEENIKKIVEERERIITELKTFGYIILPTQSNFFLMKLPSAGEANKIFTSLKEKKILVRYWTSQILNRYIRVSIGTPEQNNRVIEELKNLK